MPNDWTSLTPDLSEYVKITKDYTLAAAEAFASLPRASNPASSETKPFDFVFKDPSLTEFNFFKVCTHTVRRTQIDMPTLNVLIYLQESEVPPGFFDIDGPPVGDGRHHPSTGLLRSYPDRPRRCKIITLFLTQDILRLLAS